MSDHDKCCQQSDLTDLQEGTAILATCIAQSLSAVLPQFEEIFLEKLRDAYVHLKDNAGHDRPVVRQMELLNWTRQHLTGYSQIEGQGKKFLED